MNLSTILMDDGVRGRLQHCLQEDIHFGMTKPALPRPRTPLVASPNTSGTLSRFISDYSVDDLYSLTDDEETLEVPLFASNSVKQQAAKAKARARCPSLIIPSPSYWPKPPSYIMVPWNAEKAAEERHKQHTSAAVSASDKHPSSLLSRASTPSLDDGTSSVDHTTSSCPSTPKTRDRSPVSPLVPEWDPPARLAPEVLALLDRFALAESTARLESPTASECEQKPYEMQQVPTTEITIIRGHLAPTNRLAAPVSNDDEIVSALTVPSPGGFFGSLHQTARQTWCPSSSVSTGTAEKFYGVPWRDHSPSRQVTGPKVSRNLGLKLKTQFESANPLHDRKDSLFSPDAMTGVLEINENTFLCTPSSGDTLERTAKWLSSQYQWTASLKSDVNIQQPTTPLDKPIATPPKLVSCFSPVTPSTPGSRRKVSFDESPAKRSIQTLASVPEVLEAGTQTQDAETESLFLQGFQWLTKRLKNADSATQGQIRVEALHVMSSSSSADHIAQLLSEYSITNAERREPSRPISALVPAPELDDEAIVTMAQAKRERQVLRQLLPSMWDMYASKHILGSQLIASPVAARLRCSTKTNILDYAGKPCCDWAWTMALQYRSATVTTLSVGPTKNAIMMPSGPPNQKLVHSTSPTILPFADNTFDLISARSLHSTLTTLRRDQTQPHKDQYDIVLAEFHRVLKPGGYLEFRLQDAELLNPSPKAAALGGEFASLLRQRGYDPHASRYFLPRLKNAGFAEVKRAWMVLPCADVVPKWIDRGKTERQVDVSGRAGNATAKKTTTTPEVVLGRNAKDGPPSLAGRNSADVSGLRRQSRVLTRASRELPCTERTHKRSDSKMTDTTGAAPSRPRRHIKRMSGDSPPKFYNVAVKAADDGRDGAAEEPGRRRCYERPLTGSTADVRPVTGLVGARAWEEWIVGLQREVGGDEEAALARVNRALEEAGRDGKAGWRCLVGWASKGDA